MAVSPRMAFLAGCAVTLALGLQVERSGRLYGGRATESYKFFDTLVDIRSQILRNYVEAVDEKKLLEGAVRGMMNELDPYSNYFSKEELASFDQQTRGQFSGIGAEMSQDPQTGAFLVVSPLEDSPALKAGVLAGDRLLKVNGDKLENMVLKDVIGRVAGPSGTSVTLTVLHEGEKTPVDLVITRAVIQVQSVKGFRHTSDGGWDFLIDPEHRTAYVRITNFMETTAEELDKALLPLFKSPEGLKGLILDVRFNPGGLLVSAEEISDRFLESGVIVSTRGRNGKQEHVAEAHKEGTYPKVPMVVLVNEYSASASEIVSGALKDQGRALLIGTRTFGKGSVQNLIPLEGGQAAVKLTTAHYYLPSGRNISRKKDATTWGVEPDAAFIIPLTDQENKQLLRARASSDVIHNHQATSMPIAGGAMTETATTSPSAPLDRQLQKALEVLVAHQSLSGESVNGLVTTVRSSVSAALPATQKTPATQPK